MSKLAQSIIAVTLLFGVVFVPGGCKLECRGDNASDVVDEIGDEVGDAIDKSKDK
jgi:hypothetical protein